MSMESFLEQSWKHIKEHGRTIIGVLPAEYALNLNASKADLQAISQTSAQVQPLLDAHAGAAGAGAKSTELSENESAELSQFLASDGKLYGSATTGGPSGEGTIFSVTTAKIFAVVHGVNAAATGERVVAGAAV